MKKVLILFMVVLFTNASAQTKPAPANKPAPKTAPATPAPTVLKNGVDSLSYAIGVLDGTFFKTQGVTKVNAQVLGKGFSDVMNGKPLYSPEVANEIVRREMQKMTQARVQPNIDQGKKFLDENRKKPGVKETPSGLQYEVIQMGTGPKPSGDTTVVKVHYDGFLLNGTKIDSSRDRGQPYTTPLNEVIRGWTEGVQLMPVGSRFKFYIPYTLGYGMQGSGQSIPGGSVLVFDIELIEIVSNQ
jgi:FKBP-type peptidyl-prolyl cis-trans isomerase